MWSKLTHILFLELIVGLTVCLTTQIQAQPVLTSLEPDTIDVEVPENVRGPEMFGTPVLRVLEMGQLYVRYTIFLYEDGTIIWRNDFKDFNYDANRDAPYQRISEANERFEDWVFEHGPYRLGKVDVVDVTDFIEEVSERGYCEDPGYALPRPFHAPFSNFVFANESCIFSISQPFDYQKPDTLYLPGGIVELNTRSREEVLRHEHERIRRAYEVHEFIRNTLDAMVTKAKENGSEVDIGYLRMQPFPVSE